MERELWLTSCFLIVTGIGLLAGGVLSRWYTRRRSGRRVTKARVIKLLLREDPSSDVKVFRNCYYPVFEFYVNGKLHKETYPYGAYPSPFEVGQEVRISFDPEHPGEYEICERSAAGYLPEILSISGAVIFALGAVLFIRFASRG